MSLETSDTPASAAKTQSTSRRRFKDEDVGSRMNSKRSKRIPDDDDNEDYAAASCLVSLSRCGDAAAITVDCLNDEKPAETNLCYKCGVCGKTFPSYQSLGGHKTSHRNKPSTDAAAASLKFSENSNCASRPQPCPILRLHRCSICHKNFPTGQALGGHKRKHYVGVIGRKGGARPIVANCSEDVSGASGVTSNDGGAVIHSHGGGDDVMAPISRDFDLNLPPSPELDLTLNLM